MGKAGWITYSVIVVGIFVVFLLGSVNLALTFMAGLTFGIWGGAVFPWRKFDRLNQ